MKPICIPCQRFYRPEKTGFSFIEGMPNAIPGTGRTAAPGTAEADHWSDYKLWRGDLWKCPGCESLIVVGVGASPEAEHYEDGFVALKIQRGATFRVNDC